MEEENKEIKPLIIKPADIPKYRRMLALKQDYKCPICGKTLASGGVIALDHCHQKGRLRATLHASCNSSIGRMETGAKRMQKTSHIVNTNFLQYLKNVVKFLEKAEKEPVNVIHPSFDYEKGKQKPKKRQRRKA